MKNIKDITISIFAIIGFVFILSSFTNQSQPQITYGTPESHVWDIIVADGNENRPYAINKVTGEVRKYSRTYPDFKGVSTNEETKTYVVMKEIK